MMNFHSKQNEPISIKSNCSIADIRFLIKYITNKTITFPIYVQCLTFTRKLGFPIDHTCILAYEREIYYTKYKNLDDDNTISGIEIVNQQQSSKKRKFIKYQKYQLKTPLTGQKFADILEALVPYYLSRDYNIATHNCNHFVRDFLYLVNNEFRLPKQIFRINTIAYYFIQFGSEKQLKQQEEYQNNGQECVL